MEVHLADGTLLTLTADIVAAYVANNQVTASTVPELITVVHDALSRLGAPVEEAAAPQKPAVSVRASIRSDYLVCLEDGGPVKMLKRYLRSRFDLSPEQYREKWGLPHDYPMVAPNYAETRRALAHSIGLGRKPAEVAAPVVAAVKSARKKLCIVAAKAAAVAHSGGNSADEAVSTPAGPAEA